MKEKDSLKTDDLAGTVAEALGNILEEAESRGHKSTTVGSGVGAGIGAVVGSFGGPVGAVILGAVGAFVGNRVGDFLDNDN